MFVWPHSNGIYQFCVITEINRSYVHLDTNSRGPNIVPCGTPTRYWVHLLEKADRRHKRSLRKDKCLKFLH